jgi:hypothetical protein
LNIGINNSGWSGNFIVPAGDTGYSEFPHDSYITAIGGNVAVRTDADLILAANLSLIVLPKDGNFTLINTNLAFSDGTVQTSAIEDVAALYANIGTLQINVNELDANVGAQLYTMGNYQNWTSNVTTISSALDQLAERLKALGG